MIIVKKNSYLKYKNFRFRCAIGKAGIKKKLREGDNITPKGTYQITRIYYRKDRIKKIKTKIKLSKIKKNFGWCDQPDSKFYNRLIDIPNKLSHEKLYRKDNIYDVIIVLNYNMYPTIQYKGSAIFIHVAKRNFTPTKGCVAISKKNLLYLIERISKKTKIIIL